MQFAADMTRRNQDFPHTRVVDRLVCVSAPPRQTLPTVVTPSTIDVALKEHMRARGDIP
jgi:hypothetical protein